MTEGTGKPEKISLDQILGEGDTAAPGGEEDGIIEVVAETEPGLAEARSPEAESRALEDGGPSAADCGDPGAAQVEELLTETLREKDRMHEMYLRARADLENFRRRVERDREEDRLRSAGGIVLEILPAIDNLDRALAQPPEAAGFREGVALIRRQIDDALRKVGLESIEALGETFDPVCHEAIAAEPREGFAPNTIIEEIRKGYVLGGRVLRPSLVKVVLAPQTAATEPTGEPGGADGPNHRD